MQDFDIHCVDSESKNVDDQVMGKSCWEKPGQINSAFRQDVRRHQEDSARLQSLGSGAGTMNHAELKVMATIDTIKCAATKTRWKNDVRPLFRRIRQGPADGQPRPLQSIVCSKCASGDRNQAHHCLCENKTASKKEEKDVYLSVVQQIKTMIDGDPQWGPRPSGVRHSSSVQTLAQINQSRCTAPLFAHVSANTTARGRLGTDVTSSAHGNAAAQATAGQYLTCVTVCRLASCRMSLSHEWSSHLPVSFTRMGLDPRTNAAPCVCV